MDLLSDLLRWLQVAVGIGLVIFVHELGHFLAARWCKVRVEVFSLGFGPRLLSFQRGPTTYQLAAVPLGGYVKMAGDEGRDPAREAGPDELPSKSVGQRFFIYSGGVLMNLLFALLLFPLLFLHGVPFLEPMIGQPDGGTPAWHAGLTEGTRVLRVNGERVFEFNHIPTQIALADEGRVELEILSPGAAHSEVVAIEPRYEDPPGWYSIDVMPAVDPTLELTIALDSAAQSAGLATGDRLLEVLQAPPGMLIDAQLSLALSSGEPIELRVQGPAGEKLVRLEPQFRANPDVIRLGIGAPLRWVHDLRSSRLVRELGLCIDDRLLAVNDQLLWRAGDLERALEHSALQAGPLRLKVERAGRELELQALPLAGECLGLARDLAIRGDTEQTVLTVTPRMAAAAAGLLDGDRVLSVDGRRVERWTDVQKRVEVAAKLGASLQLAIERSTPSGPSLLEIEAKPQPYESPYYGLSLRSAHYVYQAHSPLEAVQVGAMCSWKFVEEAWLTLRGMVRGRVSSENLGGIIAIGSVSYSLAEEGWVKLLFFLCMLSVNLAFLNVLPIPVLDGGHLFFLIVEKLKGSPVSERVLGYSQMVGVVLIISLMVYVTFNDIQRLLT